MPDDSLRIAVVVRVVDNFGDAGVAWRLARQLHAEHGAEVVLWIDAPDVLARFVRGADAPAARVVVDGVRVQRLPPDCDAGDAPALAPWPHLVVEAFGCGLPDAWLDAMERSSRAPVWVNLEYLSAETWVEGTHGLRSPHPTRALARWFWFPGFTGRSGGLLRERDLLAQRDAFVADPAHRARAWAEAGAAPAPADALHVSLFCYPNGAATALLDAWARGPRPVAALVPEGVATQAVESFAGRRVQAGTRIDRGALSLAVVPFVDQRVFDRRLWACDFSIVRGEDSFVRAQWAASAFCWHIYPQDDDAHRAKLDAFLARFAAGLAPGASAALIAFTHAFNAMDAPAVAAAWPGMQQALPALRAHARRWADELAAMPDLATQLVDFARSRL
ncbi:MAG TPA: elongation factor P maturation arginine rhamnosyltransferase EarP [Casimicrobiaceae bacterium]|nr:elongation factor P maturation arginine rhamnosyltransferase EarP [Casimicrobiaceae bacterium]